MNWKVILVLTAGVIAGLITNALADEPPNVKNTEMSVNSAAGGLAPLVNQLLRENRGERWVGYRVPTHPGVHMCCGAWDCRGCECDLESSGSYYNSTNDDEDEILDACLMYILFRLDDQRIVRLRAFTEDCRLNAHGVPFTWLADVRPEESLAWLTSVAEETDRSYSMDRVVEPAVSTIAMHDHPTVLDVLERFIAEDRPADLREQAVFWIGNTGGPRSIDILKRVLRDDSDPDIREKAVFALTLPEGPDAVDVLIDVARHDRDADIRSNALFWLSNKAGQRAVEAISDAIENDPDTDVKEQAVFALSQLPDDEGIPLLMNVARTNRNPDVREQAIFWLGQSNDPRVIDFFEEILAK